MPFSSPSGNMEMVPEQVAGSRECGRIAVRTRYMLWNLSKGSRDQEVMPHRSSEVVFMVMVAAVGLLVVDVSSGHCYS